MYVCAVIDKRDFALENWLKEHLKKSLIEYQLSDTVTCYLVERKQIKDQKVIQSLQAASFGFSGGPQ